MTEGDILRVLTGSAVLQGVDPSATRFLVRVGEVRRFGDGDVLMRQGEDSLSLHFVLSGSIRVELSRRSDERPVTLAELGIGQTVGEMGLLTGADWSATVVAAGPTETLEIGRASFDEAAAGFPMLHRMLTGVLRARLVEHSANKAGL